MIDIDKVRDAYLRICGSCDYGLNEYGCNCPDKSDPRWVIQQLCDELELHRQVASRIAQESRQPGGIAGQALYNLLGKLPT